MFLTSDIISRSQAIQRFVQEGGEIAAVFPIHYPRELLRAFSLLPVEVWGPKSSDQSLATEHLPDYACSIVKSGLALILEHRLDMARAILVPHCCDTLQGLGSVLLDFVRPKPQVLTIYIPRGERASDCDFLAKEIASLYQKLAALTGRKPTPKKLMDAILREEEADAAMQQLAEQKARLPHPDELYFQLLRSREYLPAESFSELANKMLGDVGQPNNKKVGLVVSGLVPEPAHFLDTVSKVGATIIADDFASSGRRIYPAGISQDPFVRMAQRIQSGPPDAMRGSPIANRLVYLQHLVKKHRARGVVFYTIKFCEPELFDLPLLRSGLNRLGIPSIEIEVEIGQQLPSQTETRLGAFVEMLT